MAGLLAVADHVSLQMDPLAERLVTAGRGAGEGPLVRVDPPVHLTTGKDMVK